LKESIMIMDNIGIPNEISIKEALEYLINKRGASIPDQYMRYQ